MRLARSTALLALPLLLAAADPAAGSRSTYTLTFDFAGDPDREGSESLLAAFSSLDGVRSARLRPDTHWTIELTVSSPCVITPADLRAKLSSPGDLRAVRIGVTGRVVHQGDTWILCADGSRYCYGVLPTDDLEQAADEGCTRFRIEGELSEEPQPWRFRHGAIIIETATVEAEPR